MLGLEHGIMVKGEIGATWISVDKDFALVDILYGRYLPVSCYDYDMISRHITHEPYQRRHIRVIQGSWANMYKSNRFLNKINKS